MNRSASSLRAGLYWYSVLSVLHYLYCYELTSRSVLVLCTQCITLVVLGAYEQVCTALYWYNVLCSTLVVRHWYLRN